MRLFAILLAAASVAGLVVAASVQGLDSEAIAWLAGRILLGALALALVLYLASTPWPGFRRYAVPLAFILAFAPMAVFKALEPVVSVEDEVAAEAAITSQRLPRTLSSGIRWETATADGKTLVFGYVLPATFEGASEDAKAAFRDETLRAVCAEDYRDKLRAGWRIRYVFRTVDGEVFVETDIGVSDCPA
ncbi:hypothetical protein L1787_04050 [Acuticoccus sp. M5D2P5]|uniref:hypothetical protein n=1 Tax=Acuticoccus kalidii TaxID=2910977 RepID=UPI001F3639BF|nr:hypothetical protein [Acuticoccus kalidii]MCF3932588.1 hypothetical protein [Acuticoccus kalidii]